MPTIDVRDANSVIQTVGKYIPGRAVATDSAPVVLASAAPVNRSGTIITGGSAQQLMASNAVRGGWCLQNLSTADLWVSDVGAAALGTGFRVGPGVLHESQPGGAAVGVLSVFGITTGQAFTAREF
jgi:hypothetical protein